MEEVDVEPRYRVLGPLATVVDGRRVPLGGRRQRMVLALLLAKANRVVSQDALVDGVWNGAEPAGGARTLHTYVSVLRKALDGGIERDGPGYVLRAEPGDIDALCFEASVAEGRACLAEAPLKAADRLRSGLGLWTGPAYGDLGAEPPLMPEASRLTAERLDALELRFEADLAVGRHAQIVPELEAMLRDEPYREHLASMLMLALYRTGRPAEALRIYREVRSRLVEELGIDPGAALQELELRIIDRDPGLDIEARARSAPQGARGYELHEMTGDSDFGVRHRGFQGTMAREVSVLVLGGSDLNTPGFIRRFDTEMQIVTGLEHPNLAPVLDYWRDPVGAVVITPQYSGGTLEAVLADGHLDLGTAIRIADRVASALDFLHRQDYPHGAVSSRSILVDDERNPYLTDLGLTRILGPEREPQIVDDIERLGTLVVDMIGSEVIGHSDIGHAVARARHPEPHLRFGSVEEFGRALRQCAGLDVQPLQVQAPVADQRRNPYKGLSAFQESDTGDFHGRDELIEELVAGIEAGWLLAVVGPSGAGKSSVVRAGLVPRLRAGAIEGSESWLITTMFPGAHPFEALVEALQRVSTVEGGDLWSALDSGTSGLLDGVDAILPGGDGLLLVIDQFEELFSSAVPSVDRDRFLGLLTSCVEVRGRVRVVVTLRADFFDQPLQHPGFADIFRENIVAVGPPTVDGLARAVSQPAIRCGVSLEPGLVNRIVDDTRERPGALPSLQFVLTELFARRSGDVMTLDSYETLGGVGGALANRAEEAYAGLSPARREVARQLFLRLVTVDEVADDTRRRVNVSELVGLDAEGNAMRDLIDRFGALRFLSFDRDPASRTPTVELAHEAVLQRWQRLSGWIDERREDLLIHRRLQIAVDDWLAGDRDPSFLLRGSRLEQAQAWLERTDIAVTDDERSLLEESDTVEAEEVAAQAHLQRVAARRRQAVLVVVAVAAVLAGALGVYGLSQRSEALGNAQEATVRELALASRNIAEDDPELAILLGAEAVEVGRSAGDEPAPEALGALWSAYVEHRVRWAVQGVGQGGVAYHPDGRMLAVDAAPGGDGIVTLRDAETGEELGRLPSSSQAAAGLVESMAFSADGELLVVGRGPSEEGRSPVLEVFDIARRELVAEFPVGDDQANFVMELDVSDAGLVSIPTYGVGTSVEIYDAVADRVVGEVDEALLGGPIIGFKAGFLPGSDDLVLLSRRSETPQFVTVDARTGAVLRDVAVGVDVGQGIMTLHPQAPVAAIGDENRQVAVLDLNSGEPVFPPVPHPDPQSVVWSLDGSRLAVSGNESDIAILDGTTGATLVRLSGHKASVYSTAFHPDGTSLASVSLDGELRVWDITPSGPAGLVDGLGDVARLDGAETGLVVGTDGDGVRLLDPDTSEVLRHYPDFVEESVLTTKTAAAAGLAAGLTSDLSNIVTNLLTGAVVGELPPCTADAALSPDGRYALVSSVGPGPNDDAVCTAGTVTGIVEVETGDLIVDRSGIVAPWGAISGADTFDGSRYAAITFDTGRADNMVEVYALAPTRLVATLTTDDLGTEFLLVPEFTPDARYLAIGTNGPTAIVIDVEALAGGDSGAEATVFKKQVHNGNAPHAFVTPDGMVATVGLDGFYRFWDSETGDLRFEIEATGIRGYPAHAFSPDFETYYYEDGNGVVRAMPTDVDELIRTATSAVTRGLTDDECRRYLHTDGCSAT